MEEKREICQACNGAGGWDVVKDGEVVDFIVCYNCREKEYEKDREEWTVDETVIYRYDNFIRIIAGKDGKEVIVDPDELKWPRYDGGQDVGVYESLTLKEISNQLIALGYHRVFYVWVELGLSGQIYQYGNYDPHEWAEHGTTRGYA